jgi:hypothetical protein
MAAVKWSSTSSRACVAEWRQSARGCRGWRVFELEEVLDDPAQLAAHRGKLAATQALHLLGQVLKVEGAVDPGGREPAQLRRLRLGPGIVVGLVQGPLQDLGHHNLLDLPLYSYHNRLRPTTSRALRPSRLRTATAGSGAGHLSG